jgi:cation diffusion facilitator CzcD-associated flavoprotein CzcO
MGLLPSDPHLVLIVGGGPAGLTLVHECQRRGIQSLVSESGEQVGQSRMEMPGRLVLLSTWFQNVLFNREWTRRDALKRVPARKFAAYLSQQAKVYGLNVRLYEPVREVRHMEKGWLVRARSDHYASLLVNATGYYAQPYRPALKGATETRIAQNQFRDYRNPRQAEALLNGRLKQAIIVGKRISAGQVAEELVEAGWEVSLACRSPVTFAHPG